jgi:hypothetical protein
MGRLFEGLCLFCFCVVLVALAIAVLDATMLSTVNSFGSCERARGHASLPGFYCTGPLLDQVAGFLLNLPLLLFVYAPLLTLFPPPAQDRSGMFLMYAVDVGIVLGIIYPVLWLVQRSRAKSRA